MVNIEQGADIIRYFRVERHDLVYLKFILEGYEGMSTLSTVEKKGALVSLSVPAGFAADMDELIAALKMEIRLEETGEEVACRIEESDHA